MNTFFKVATLAVVGIIIADLVANASGTSALFSGVNNLFSTTVGGLLGKPSSGGGTASA